MKCRKAKDGVKIGDCNFFRISKVGASLLAVQPRHVGGVILNQAFVWNVRTCRFAVNGGIQLEASQ